MAIQTILPVPYPLNEFLSTNANVLANADGEGIGMVFQAPETGSIDRIGFHLGGVTTGATVTGRVETVETTNGLNSGTLWATDTTGTVVVGNNDDGTWKEITLTASASVTQGDYVAVIFTAGAGTNLNFRKFISPMVSGTLPYTLQNTGSWAKAVDRPAITIRYSDTRYYPIPGVYGMLNAETTQSISSSTTPDEAGLKFTLPFRARMYGAQVWITLAGATKDYTLKLYNSTDTLVSDEVIDGAYTADGMAIVPFLDQPELEANEIYRLTILPSTTTAFNLKYGTLMDAAYLEQSPGRDLCSWTQRTDAGAWTDDDLKVPWMTPILNGLEPTGTGGGYAVGYVSL